MTQITKKDITNRSFCLLIAVLLLFICTFSGCKDAVYENISDYADEPIFVTGLGEDFTVTPRNLAEMKLVKRGASGTSAKAGDLRVIGPTMETFLKYYGYTFDDIKTVRFLCSDDYEITLTRRSLQENEVILGIAEANSPLQGIRRPLRILIPEQPSSQWAYAVIEMDFVLVNNG